MSKLLSIVIAAAFAAASANAVAQSKDVTTKAGGAVKSKDGKDVATKEVKETPKAKPKASKPAEAPKPKAKGADVKTKSGGPVGTKDGKDVTTKGK